MPVIHLPVQSGSNKILDAMNRKHTINEYLELIEKLKNAKPNIKFSSDFIIGYPGETDEDYQQTVKLMKNIEFIHSYYLYLAQDQEHQHFDLKSWSENFKRTFN